MFVLPVTIQKGQNFDQGTRDPSPFFSEYGRAMLADAGTSIFSTEPIIYGAVRQEDLPVRRWNRAIHEAFTTHSPKDVQYEMDVLGRPELRLALASFLNCNQATPCSPDEIVVFNMSFNALSLFCRIFLEPGDTIAVENPGFGGMRDVAAFLNLDILPVQLDSEGLSLEALRASAKSIKMVYVTPNHQEPGGVTMTLTRRKELLKWAQASGAIIIEDEYDGLFHYGTTMPPSIKSLDTKGNVIYLGSFWQILYPLTTLCFAAIPVCFIEALLSAKRHTSSLTESQSQVALAQMLTDGYLQKHMRKLERSFGAKRRALLYELKRILGTRIILPTTSGGLTVMASFIDYDDSQILEAARAANLALIPTSKFYCEGTTRALGEFLIYFAGLEEEQVAKKVKNFVAQLNNPN